MIVVVTNAATVAAVDGSPLNAATTASTKNAGAIVRSAVSAIGRGAMVASNPVAHASQSSISATSRGASDQSRNAAEAAGPAVSGSATHAMRSNHSGIGRVRVTPFRVVVLNQAASDARRGRPYSTSAMTSTLRAPVLVPGLATGIGSLPHTDARDAAEVVLRCLPEFPAAPQLPARDPREGMLAQWLGALPEVEVGADGSFAILGTSDLAPECVFDESAHAGLLAFLDAASALERATGAREGPGHRALDARCRVARRRRSGAAARSGARQKSRACGRSRSRSCCSTRLPQTSVVLFFDEPALVAWRRGNAPLDRESAIDVLSGALAAVDCVTGVHVCGDGDLGLALESGPQVLGVEVSEALVRDAVALSRFLDGDGWIAWGAIPTDRPVGESADKHWRRLATVWCELTRRGCDPVPLRARGHDHPGLRARGLWCLASRAGARHRAGARRSRARPGRCGPPHAGSLNLEPTSYRYCGVCGQPLEAGATVCGNCGAAVEPTADDAMTGAIVGDTGEATPAGADPHGRDDRGGRRCRGRCGRCRRGRRGRRRRRRAARRATDDGGMSPAQKWLIAVLIVLAIVLVGVIAAVALDDGDDDKPPTTTTTSTSTTTTHDHHHDDDDADHRRRFRRRHHHGTAHDHDGAADDHHDGAAHHPTTTVAADHHHDVAGRLVAVTPGR